MKAYVAFATAIALLSWGHGAAAQDAAPIAAKQLAQEFANDKDAAVRKYGGKVILLTGEIRGIRLNQFGTATMMLDGENTGEGVWLWLRANQNAQAVAVGQRVTLRCAMQKDNYVVQDCVFVR